MWQLPRDASAVMRDAERITRAKLNQSMRRKNVHAGWNSYTRHATGRFDTPRKAQPPMRTGSSSVIRRSGMRAKIVGSATWAIIAREAQAPAQKCGPAPNAMLFDV